MALATGSCQRVGAGSMSDRSRLQEPRASALSLTGDILGSPDFIDHPAGFTRADALLSRACADDEWISELLCEPFFKGVGGLDGGDADHARGRRVAGDCDAVGGVAMGRAEEGVVGVAADGKIGGVGDSGVGVLGDEAGK